MTFKEDFKPSKVYNKLVNDVCYNADCLEKFEKQRLVVANPFSYNKSARSGIIAEFDNGYTISKEIGVKRNFITIGMRVWDIIRKNRYAVTDELRDLFTQVPYRNIQEVINESKGKS